jgi:hypothetical protein
VPFPIVDPLAHSTWSKPETVAGFAQSELGMAGFVPDPAVPLTEYNRPRPGMLQASRAPVIYEAAFRRVA